MLKTYVMSKIELEHQALYVCNLVLLSERLSNPLNPMCAENEEKSPLSCFSFLRFLYVCAEERIKLHVA